MDKTGNDLESPRAHSRSERQATPSENGVTENLPDQDTEARQSTILNLVRLVESATYQYQ